MATIVAERRWIGRARPLGAGAPGWAKRMYERSLLVLRALTDRRSGAAVAGAREGWAYVWPRDAGAVAIAFASAGYHDEARRMVRFLLDLDLEAAARFRGSGEPVEGREAQGDAAGWVVAAARAAGVPASIDMPSWRSRADYQEKDVGSYLGNAVASAADRAKTRAFRSVPARRPNRIQALFGTGRGLVRRESDANSGLDTTAAWAVRPFPQPSLFPLVRRTLLLLASTSGRFGLLPSEDWDGGEDPWTAPTAWTAWSLAALARGDRRSAALAVTRRDRSAAIFLARREREAGLCLLAALRRAATPLGLLPERVDADTGAPTSTTPLAWSHAFAILALRELWPGRPRT
jgi:glucoamylase